MIKLGSDACRSYITLPSWSAPENAHIAARTTADTGRLIPGTALSAAFNKVTRSRCKLVQNWLITLEYIIQMLTIILRIL
jgi:hypothetical protein